MSDPTAIFWQNALCCVNGLVCVVGCFSNGLIVLTTYKNRSLRSSTATLLISLNSLFYTFHQLIWVFLFTWLQFSKAKWSLFACMFAALPAIICSIGSYLSILLICVDRLICIFFSTCRYKSRNSILYFSLLSLFSIAFLFSAIQFPIRNALASPGSFVVCQPSVISAGPLGSQYDVLCLCLVLLSVLCYFLLWSILNFLTQNPSNHEETRGLLKPTLALLFVMLASWLLEVSTKIIVAQQQYSSAHVLVERIGQILFNLVICSNVFLLSYFSSKYSLAFCGELNAFRSMIKKSMGIRSDKQVYNNPVNAINLKCSPAMTVAVGPTVGNIPRETIDTPPLFPLKGRIQSTVMWMAYANQR